MSRFIHFCKKNLRGPFLKENCSSDAMCSAGKAIIKCVLIYNAIWFLSCDPGGLKAR